MNAEPSDGCAPSPFGRFGLLGYDRLLTPYRQGERHSHEFATIFYQFKAHSGPQGRLRITHHVVTTLSPAGYDQAMAAFVGILDGFFPAAERLLELNTLWLAVILFWNDSYGCVQWHFSPSPTFNPTLGNANAQSVEQELAAWLQS
jgi:hypothetical protein